MFFSWTDVSSKLKQFRSKVGCTYEDASPESVASVAVRILEVCKRVIVHWSRLSRLTGDGVHDTDVDEVETEAEATENDKNHPHTASTSSTQRRHVRSAYIGSIQPKNFFVISYIRTTKV